MDLRGVKRVCVTRRGGDPAMCSYFVEACMWRLSYARVMTSFWSAAVGTFGLICLNRRRSSSLNHGWRKISAGVGRLAGFFERHREIYKLVGVRKGTVHIPSWWPLGNICGWWPRGIRAVRARSPRTGSPGTRRTVRRHPSHTWSHTSLQMVVDQRATNN